MLTDSRKQQVRSLVERDPDYYPMHTEDGKWRHDKPVWTHWCDGFLPGMMWIFHRQHAAAGSSDGEVVARASSPLLAAARAAQVRPRRARSRLHLPVHLSTAGISSRRTPALNEVLVQAGQTLAVRFNEKGQYLRSFVAEDSLFIDIMMNVGIIFYAARETGDRSLRDVAMRHALTTRRVLVRGDGSTAHEGIFDLETGEFLRQTTQQGYRGDSCWSRGLAWALVRLQHLLRIQPRSALPRDGASLRRLLHHALARRRVPPWDFNAPLESRKLLDTSAAAIAAAGLLRLCRLVPDPMKGHLYWTTAHAHSSLAVREASGRSDSQVGRHSEGRRLSRAQGTGRERIGDVGRVLLSWKPWIQRSGRCKPKHKKAAANCRQDVRLSVTLNVYERLYCCVRRRSVTCVPRISDNLRSDHFAGHDEFHAAILLPARRGVVRRHGHRFAESFRRKDVAA